MSSTTINLPDEGKSGGAAVLGTSSFTQDNVADSSVVNCK